jgi:sortase A
MTPERRRRVPLAGLATLLVAGSLGLVGWALTDDAGPTSAARPVAQVEDDPVIRVATTPTTAPSTSAPPATEAAALPVPEDAPADAYAATPEVVHGTLALPSIGVEQPLHEGVTLTAIDRGPSHWPGTAMPGGLGNVVVAGHRTTHSRPFHDLDLLKPGDPLVFRMADGTEHTYVHTATEIVGPDAMHIVTQTPEHRATLFACHPKGSAAQRIVAHFELVV